MREIWGSRSGVDEDNVVWGTGDFLIYKYLSPMCTSFEMWCQRRMEKISWTDHVRNEEVLLRVKEQRNILHEIRKRKANWIGHILRRNCLLQWVIEGKIQGGIEVTGRQGRRRRKLLDVLKERRGYSHLKEEALDRTMWRARFGPVVRQTTKWMNAYKIDISYFRLKVVQEKWATCILKMEAASSSEMSVAIYR